MKRLFSVLLVCVSLVWFSTDVAAQEKQDKKSKKVEPYYKMHWSEDIPIINNKDANGKTTKINLVAGQFQDKVAQSPNPDSWAADPNNHIQIWTFNMESGAEFRIPGIDYKVTRSLYFYEGDSFTIGDTEINKNHLIELNPEQEVKIVNGSKQGYFLFLQGCPISEPIIQYGPFVANTKEDLQETMQEYQRTQFGGWPWASTEPVHDKQFGRFSRTPDGKKIHK